MTDNRTTELLDGLRNVGNLHEFAELFGFNWYDDSDWVWHDVAVKMADDFEQAIAATLGEQIVRCRDCKHATISTTGVCKYCEMFVLPDVDGYGADPQVNLPLDFFCGFAERKEVD